MTLWQRFKRPPWRTLVLLAALLGIFGLGYLCWSPGERVTEVSVYSEWEMSEEDWETLRAEFNAPS